MRIKMKRFFLTSVLVLIILSIAFADDTLIDSYSEVNVTSNFYIADGLNVGGRTAAGVSFEVSASGLQISSCKFYLKKQGSPTGDMVAKLYTHAGTFGESSIGTGTALATSTGIDASTLSTSYALITFTFTSSYALVNGAYYVVVVEWLGSGYVNYIFIGYKSEHVEGHGNFCYEKYGSAWSYNGTQTPAFYVYGSPAAATGAGQVIIIGD
jgi:hypothetical protein